MDEFFSGRAAIHVACQNGHVDVVKSLIRFEANLEEEVCQSSQLTYPVTCHGDS